jgi:hypothetical protein
MLDQAFGGGVGRVSGQSGSKGSGSGFGFEGGADGSRGVGSGCAGLVGGATGSVGGIGTSLPAELFLPSKESPRKRERAFRPASIKVMQRTFNPWNRARYPGGPPIFAGWSNSNSSLFDSEVDGANPSPAANLHLRFWIYDLRAYAHGKRRA